MEDKIDLSKGSLPFFKPIEEMIAQKESGDACRQIVKKNIFYCFSQNEGDQCRKKFK